ncbi:MAG: hypothetical protein WCS70_06855 [Verrucomicrobiota bacterium]
MKVFTATAPAAWASYLINNDDSGLDRAELAAADKWIRRMDLGRPISCEPAGITRYHDAVTECPYLAECETYTFLV